MDAIRHPKDPGRLACRTAALALWLLPALATADLPASADPRPASPGADLVVRWSYDALGTAGGFRLYRGADLATLAPIAELAVHTGPHRQRFVVAEARRSAAVYQLCYVDAHGRETVLQTFTWTPPSLSPVAVASSAGSWTSAILASPLPRQAPAATAAVRPGSPGGADLWRREPAVPPPRRAAARFRRIEPTMQRKLD
jgi:hypothetical protein